MIKRNACSHFPPSILLFSVLFSPLICCAGEDVFCQLSSPLWNLTRMWLWVNLSCPPGHLFTHPSVHLSIDSSNPSLPSFVHPLPTTPLNSSISTSFPKQQIIPCTCKSSAHCSLPRVERVTLPPRPQSLGERQRNVEREREREGCR